MEKYKKYYERSDNMERAEQKKFIEELLNNFHNCIMEKADKFPETWTGVEIRQYIVDKAKEQIAYNILMNKSLQKTYNNAIIVRNL